MAERLCRASTTSAVLVTLDEKIGAIAAENTAQKQRRLEHERQLQANLKEVYDKQKEKSLGGGMGTRRGTIQLSENMMMDIDEPDMKAKNRKYVTLSAVVVVIRGFNFFWTQVIDGHCTKTTAKAKQVLMPGSISFAVHYDCYL